jgi:hypothetical protein
LVEHEERTGDARFTFARVEAPGDLPAPDAAAVDVALLDMNAGYANVGHDAIVAIVRDAALELDDELALRDRYIRVLSYAVRDKLMVPAHESGRYRLYLGTGGPGHLDPRRNTAHNGAAEIAEDPSWEAPLWSLFDAIAADPDAALYGVCHTFGLLCRWSGAAEPALRGPEKGGAMSGVGTNVLTPQALQHPWFGRLAAVGGDRATIPVLDSRYYDLLPVGPLVPAGATPIAFETTRAGDGPGEALTMLELARDPNGTPRIFGVNSHPEIGAPERVAAILASLLERGTITPDVHEQRSAMLPMLRDDRRDERLRVGRTVFSDLVRDRVTRLVRAA